MRAILLALVLGATPAVAAPNAQLVRSVELGLARYHLSADVARFATPTVAALHLTLSGGEPYLVTRRKLKAILADPVLKEASP